MRSLQNVDTETSFFWKIGSFFSFLHAQLQLPAVIISLNFVNDRQQMIVLHILNPVQIQPPENQLPDDWEIMKRSVGDIWRNIVFLKNKKWSVLTCSFNQESDIYIYIYTYIYKCIY